MTFHSTVLSSGDTTPNLAKALAAAQGELTDANKSSSNPHFKSKYADLAEVWQTIRPVFSRHGLSVTQFVGYDKDKGCAEVTTRLMHSSGEWLQDTLGVPLGAQTAQGLGGAITYGRRYSLAAVSGIAQDDDDGETASKPARPAVTLAQVETLMSKVVGPESAAEYAAATTAWKGLSDDDKSALKSTAAAARKRFEAKTPTPAVG